MTVSGYFSITCGMHKGSEIYLKGDTLTVGKHTCSNSMNNWMAWLRNKLTMSVTAQNFTYCFVPEAWEGLNYMTTIQCTKSSADNLLSTFGISDIQVASIPGYFSCCSPWVCAPSWHLYYHDTPQFLVQWSRELSPLSVPSWLQLMTGGGDTSFRGHSYTPGRGNVFHISKCLFKWLAIRKGIQRFWPTVVITAIH